MVMQITMKSLRILYSLNHKLSRSKSKIRERQAMPLGFANKWSNAQSMFQLDEFIGFEMFPSLQQITHLSLAVSIEV